MKKSFIGYNGRREYGTGHIRSDGYLEISLGTANSRRKAHTLIAESHLGRRINKNEEVVYHLNHDKLDNRVENLIVVTRAWHKRIHGEIGLKTRFQRRCYIDVSLAKEIYSRLKSYKKTAYLLGCSEMTLWRELNKVKGILQNEKSILWTPWGQGLFQSN